MSSIPDSNQNLNQILTSLTSQLNQIQQSVKSTPLFIKSELQKLLSPIYASLRIIGKKIGLPRRKSATFAKQNKRKFEPSAEKDEFKSTRIYLNFNETPKEHDQKQDQDQDQDQDQEKDQEKEKELVSDPIKKTILPKVESPLPKSLIPNITRFQFKASGMTKNHNANEWKNELIRTFQHQSQNLVITDLRSEELHFSILERGDVQLAQLSQELARFNNVKTIKKKILGTKFKIELLSTHKF
jgi:hypothetical protein